MKEKFSYLWEAVYPIIIYAVIVVVVQKYLRLYVSALNGAPMLRQAVSQIICMPPMYYFYSRVGKGQRKLNHLALDILIIVVAGITLSVGLNQLIEISPLKQYSLGFKQISRKIYSDKHLYQLLAVGICAPVLEEILFRGVVFGNLKKVFGSFLAILFSSLIFGVMHGNMVQFLYAALLGIAFAYIYDKTDVLWTSMLAHASANIFSLMATWYGLNRFLMQTQMVTLVVGVAGVLIGVVVLARWRQV